MTPLPLAILRGVDLLERRYRLVPPYETMRRTLVKFLLLFATSQLQNSGFRCLLFPPPSRRSLSACVYLTGATSEVVEVEVEVGRSFVRVCSWVVAGRRDAEPHARGPAGRAQTSRAGPADVVASGCAARCRRHLPVLIGSHL